MSKMSLNDFIAKVKSEGLAASSHYYVTFGSRTDINGAYCEAVSLPARHLMTTDVRIFGEMLTLPHSPIYGQVQMTFIADGKMQLKEQFDSWMNQVFDKRSRKFNYYENYIEEVEITVVDKAGDTSYIVKLHEAYPIQVQDVGLQYGTHDYIRISVQFVYKWAEELSGETYAADGAKEQQKLIESGKPPQESSTQSDIQLADGAEFIMPEQMGNLTGLTESANNTANVMNSGLLDLTTNPLTAITEFSNNMSAGMSSASQTIVNYQKLVDPPSSFSTGIRTETQLLSRALGDVSGGIQELQRTVSDNISRPASLISGGIISAGSQLNSLGNLLEPFTGSNKFVEIQRDIIQVGSGIQTAGNLKGIGGRLDSFGSSMAAAGGIFKQIQNQVPIPAVSAGVSKIGNVFSGNSDGIQDIGRYFSKF